MSNLIITIIAIVIAAVVAIAALWYGGGAFTGGNARQNAIMLLQQTEQVRSALTMYASDHNGMDFGDSNLTEMNIAQAGTYLSLGKSWQTSYIPILQAKPSTYDDGAQVCFGGSNYPYYYAITRTHCVTPEGFNLINYTVYTYTDSACSSSAGLPANYWYTTASAKDSIILMCAAINQILGLPAGVTNGATGVPRVAPGGNSQYCSSGGVNYISGTYNFCYIAQYSPPMIFFSSTVH